MNFRFLFITGIVLISLLGSSVVYAQGSIKESDQLDFANGLLSRGMYDMAIAQYQKFITNFPQSSYLQEAYLSLGEGYFLSQDFNKASTTFAQFKQLYPDSVQLPLSLLRLGQIDIQEKKYDEALKELLSIDVEKQLKGPMLQSFDYYIAQAYGGKSDYASALENFKKASQVEGATDYTAYAYKEIGRIETQNGQYSLANDAYAKAESVAVDESLKVELIYRTAELGFLTGKYADAISGFGQVLNQSANTGFFQEALDNLFLAYLNLGQYQPLLDEYKKRAKGIKDDDSFFSIHFSALLAYIELKEFDKANTLLGHMLEFQSISPQEKARLFIKKSDILIREKKYKDGLALLEAHSSESIDDADEESFLKAQSYFGLADYDHAFNFYENVYQNFPKSRFTKAALLGEAHARQETGRYKESEVLFSKYFDIQDDPDLKCEALYDAVMMAVKAEDLPGTISAAEQYIKSFPSGTQYSKVLIILADSYGRANRPKDAIKLLQDYLAKPEIVQRPNAANFLLGYNEEFTGNIDQALGAYAQVDQHKENGAFYIAALKNTAIIYLHQKNEEQAKIYFDRLISQSDQNDLQVSTYIWVCNEYLKQQKFDDVLRVATQAEKKFPPPDLLEVQYFKAEALRGKGNCDEASKSYGVVIASSQKSAYTGSAHIGYGLCLAKANKFDQAKQEYQKALDENADDYTVTAHARFETANVDLSQGNTDEALKYYLLIATIYDDDYFCSESLLQAARIYEGMKRPADALKLYLEIMDKYKNSNAAKSALVKVNLLK